MRLDYTWWFVCSAVSIDLSLSPARKLSRHSLDGCKKSLRHVKLIVRSWSFDISSVLQPLPCSSIFKRSAVTFSLLLVVDDEDGSYESPEAPRFWSLTLAEFKSLVASVLSSGLEQHTQWHSESCDACFGIFWTLPQRHICIVEKIWKDKSECPKAISSILTACKRMKGA